MTCEKCGTEIREGAKFCTKCGAPVPGNADEETEISGNGTESGAEHPAAPEKKKRKRIWIPIVIVAAAVTAAVVLLIHFGVLRSHKSIDFGEYVRVWFEGYDGDGTAGAGLDVDTLGGDYNGRVRLTAEAQAEYGDFSELAYDMIDVTVSPASGLSNGDGVTVEWDVDTDALDGMTRAKIEFVCEPEEITVDGLEELEPVDLNEFLSVDFSGRNGRGTAEVSLDLDALGEKYDDALELSEEAEDEGYEYFSDLLRDMIHLYISTDSGLSDGDVVMVAWDVSEEGLDGMTVINVELSYEPEAFEVSGLE